MRRFILKTLATAIFMMVLLISANAQQETVRKVNLLTRGKTNIIKSVLPGKGSPVHIYVFRGVEGQKIDISITLTGNGEVDFAFKLPNGENVDEENFINTDWRGTLPETGEYQIRVFNPAKIRGTSRYSLKISVN